MDACKARLRRIEMAHISGTVTNLLGLVVEVEGLSGLAAVGDGLQLRTRDDRCILAEVIGFRDTALQAMAFGTLDGVAHGSRALLFDARHGMLEVTSSWLGRVIDPLAKPLDSKGILLGGQPDAEPEPHHRRRLGAHGSGRASTWAFGRSTASQRAGRASGSVCSQAPVSASRHYCRC
jgi:flagellum-specific ATP synthase